MSAFGGADSRAYVWHHSAFHHILDHVESAGHWNSKPRRIADVDENPRCTIAKHFPHCGELRATVNPKNNLAHCFRCARNINNIDLMILSGHDFVPAVTILEGWLARIIRVGRTGGRKTMP